MGKFDQPGRAAFIVDAVRTPIGKFNGSLRYVRADTLASIPIRALIERNPTLPFDAFEEVYFGCANQAGEDNRNVARFAALLGGLPSRVAAETLNRLCASGLSSVIAAARAVVTGAGDLFIAGGVEHMTRSPFVMAKSETPFDRAAQLFDTTIGWRFINPEFETLFGSDSMGETAENLNEQYKISREDQDSFACWSQSKTAKAQASGRLAIEIVRVAAPTGDRQTIQFAVDEVPRPQTSMEALSKLSAVFRAGGTVTAGTSSPLADGAAALLIASESAVRSYQLQPKARIVASAASGVEPRIMGIGPVEAVRKVLGRAGMTLDQIDIIELNEAFAVQTLACLRELGIADRDPRVNVNGGAISLGHPLGMSGARLAVTAAHELALSNKRFALITMCVGVGQGYAAILERV